VGVDGYERETFASHQSKEICPIGEAMNRFGVRKIKLPTHNDRSNARRRAWDFFSKIVRLTEQVAPGACKCVTCGAIKGWKNMDAGHYISGRRDGVLFDRRNIHPQCPQCNRFAERGSCSSAYTVWMQHKYGQAVINELVGRDRIPFEYSYQELRDLGDSFKQELERLK